MKIAVRDGKDGEWKRIAGSDQQWDDSLQDLIHQVPELISVEALEAEDPGVKLCIKTTNNEDDGGLIGIDDNGRITIVECMVASNSSIRRGILGQALECAATLWQMSYEELDNMVVSSEGRSLLELMSERIPAAEWSEERFRNAISTTLNQGNFRLIMATQGMTDELKRTIKFLSARRTFSFEMYALEIQRFSVGEAEFAVPRLISFADVGQGMYTERTVSARGTALPQEHPEETTPVEPTIGGAEEPTESDESSDSADSSELIIGQADKPPEGKSNQKETLFFAKCHEAVNQNTLEMLRKLYVFSMEAADDIIWWGSGGAGAFNFALTEDQLTVFIVAATGKIMFNFSEWQREPAYKSLLPQFLEKLKDIPALHRQRGDHTEWPDFDIEEFFSNQDDFVKFGDAVQFLKEKVGKLASPQV